MSTLPFYPSTLLDAVRATVDAGLAEPARIAARRLYGWGREQRMHALRIPELPETSAALQDHDDIWSEWEMVMEGLRGSSADPCLMEAEAVVIQAAEEAAREVGRCYAEETSDRNPPDVAGIVRPCRPGHLGGKSFVRRMVEEWRGWRGV